MFGMTLIALRSQRGLSQAEFARALGVKRPYLCALEKRETPPGKAAVEKLAAHLGITAKELLYSVGKGRCPVRLMPIRRKTAALADALAEAERADDRMGRLEDRKHVVSATTIPLVHSYLHQSHASEILAASLRDSLRVGSAAFSDLAWTLEFANVRIVRSKSLGNEQSASWWNPARESLIIAVDAAATPERQIYRLAYELGAACLFRSSGVQPLAENNREHRFLAEFAADFLMPAAAVADMVAKTGIATNAWTMPQLLAFKFHFGVSAEAFSLRLQELGLITKALRQRLRDDLRAYYKSHPAAMEPAPYIRSLTLGHRERILAARR